jgi:hypothetical protein
MRRTRLFLALSTALSMLLVGAPSALAVSDNGVGIVGDTNDKTISLTMFAVMAFFVLVIIVFSLIQAWLEQRKHSGKTASH